MNLRYLGIENLYMVPGIYALVAAAFRTFLLMEI